MHGIIGSLPHVFVSFRERLQYVPHVRFVRHRAVAARDIHLRCLLRVLVSLCKYTKYMLVGLPLVDADTRYDITHDICVDGSASMEAARILPLKYVFF